MARPSVRYPVYIISKGRAERAITARAFLKENLPFTIAVEPQEYDSYCKTIPKKFVAKLPFSNLGMGSTPARNWCWENSIQRGAKRHFIFDDNIYGFYRLDHGKRVNCESLEALSSCENFIDRYANIGVAGFNYSMFLTRETDKAFYMNCHVYSGLLINNEIPFRWRLKYNEDVDLCLQALHTRRWCTVALNIYSIKKVSTTSKMKGGNQAEIGRAHV